MCVEWNDLEIVEGLLLDVVGCVVCVMMVNVFVVIDGMLVMFVFECCGVVGVVWVEVLVM